MTDDAASGYRWILLSGVWLIYFCFGLTAVSMAPLITPITTALSIDNTQMGFILGAWPLAYIAAALPCGIMLDRLTPRTSLFIASVIMAASAFLRGLAHDPLTMFLAVALFGVGGPLVSIGAPKLVSLWFSGPSRGTAVGIYTTAPALGGVAAIALTNSLAMPLLGDWRHIMFAYAALTLATGAIWLVAASHRAALRIGIPGAAQPPFTFQTLAELMRQPGMTIFLAMGLGVFFVNHGYNNWLPEILMSRGLTPSEAGFWAAVPTLIGIAGSIGIPRLAIPKRRLGILLLLYLLVAMSSVLMLLPTDTTLVPALILLGIARGSMVGLIVLLLMDAPGIPSKWLGTATGMLYVAAEVGGVLGPVSVGFVSETTGGFGAVLYLFAGAGILLAASCQQLRRVLHRPM